MAYCKVKIDNNIGFCNNNFEEVYCNSQGKKRYILETISRELRIFERFLKTDALEIIYCTIGRFLKHKLIQLLELVGTVVFQTLINIKFTFLLNTM